MSSQLSSFEKFVTLFTRVRAGEGRAVFLFFSYVCLILISLTLFKNFRESLILGAGDATNKSYVNAIAAIVLLFFMPIYSLLFRRFSRDRLVAILALAFAAMGLGFASLNYLGDQFNSANLDVLISYSYYVWVSIFAVVMVTQFWVFANGSFNLKSGKRLFPVLLIGGSVGVLIGAQIAELSSRYLGITTGIMIASVLVAATSILPRLCGEAVPLESRCQDCDLFEPSKSVFGGLSIVAKSRLMWLIAIYSLLMNTINSSGDYLFAETLLKFADAQGQTGVQEREIFISQIHASATFWISVISLLLQMFVVSRVFIFLGLRNAVMIVPVIIACAYLLGGFFPFFSFFYALRLLDNTLDTSLTNAIRQAIFLPTSHAEKFEAKTAIDTVIWRFGDVLQAIFIYVAVKHIGWGVPEISVMCGLLGVFWIINAKLLSTEYHHRVTTRSSEGPVLNKPFRTVPVIPGDNLNLMIPVDMFETTDPSDSLKYKAELESEGGLPDWLNFNCEENRLHGNVPKEFYPLSIVITATDNSGLTAFDTFKLEPIKS